MRLLLLLVASFVWTAPLAVQARPQRLLQPKDSTHLPGHARTKPTDEAFVLLSKEASGTKPMAAPTGPQCDLTAPAGLCLYGGEKVLLPDASPQGTSARFTFDENFPIDSSPNKNHGTGVVPTGPSRHGSGASAYFPGTVWLQIPAAESLNFNGNFSLSLWVYLLSPAQSRAGDNVAAELLRDAAQSRTCALVMKRNGADGTLHYGLAVDYASDRVIGYVDGARVESSGRLLPHRWTHVTLTAQKSTQRTRDPVHPRNTTTLEHTTLSLFLNGVLDGSATRKQPLRASAPRHPAAQAPVFVGALPDHAERCQLPVYIDDLLLLNRSVSAFEVRAQSGAGLPLAASYVKLGCRTTGVGPLTDALRAGCSLQEAQDACQRLSGEAAGYHVCKALELEAGGYHLSRVMGWSDWKSQYWTADDWDTVSPEKKIGLCCLTGGH